MARYEQLYSYLESAYEVTLSTAIRIMEKHTPGLPGIGQICDHALFDESPSEYPFIFRLAYELNGRRFRPVLRIAAAIHLLQRSTFLFDDILDMSGKRADVRTTCAEFGINNAIIVGQVLQSIAVSEIASESARWRLPNRMLCLGLLMLAMAEVYKGQYLDVRHSGQPSVTPREYYQTIFLTTGQLLGRVALAGALLSNLSSSEQRSLYTYGKSYGMALQVCDDIIDVTFGSKDTGKDFGADIRMRRMRLPLIFALRMATTGQKLAFERYLTRSSVPDRHEVRRIARAIINCGATERCREVMRGFVNEALESLRCLRESESRRYLSELALDLENDLEGA
jgi:geranylgeranyl pyrophosphate synthase